MDRFKFRDSHPYKPSGFETMDTELGEDPLTSLRTMNNRLRKMAVSSSLDDKQVKVICGCPNKALGSNSQSLNSRIYVTGIRSRIYANFGLLGPPLICSKIFDFTNVSLI